MRFLALAACLLAPVVLAGEPRPLLGTTWAGTDSDGDAYQFTFEADGVLAYTSPSGSFRNARWQQVGRAVFFDMNGHHSNYLGELDGKSLAGKAWNKDGRKWTWKVTLSSEKK